MFEELDFFWTVHLIDILFIFQVCPICNMMELGELLQCNNNFQGRGQSWCESNANLAENYLELKQPTTILGVVPMRSPHWGQVDLSRIWVCQECRDYICRLKTQTHSTKGVVNISASGLANCSRGIGSIGRQKDEYSEFLLPGCHWGISYLSDI